MKHEEREYQTEIEEAIFNHWFTKKTNCIAASVGGTGKSFVMAKIVKRLITQYDAKVIVIAQDSKLLTQNSNELLRYWPEAPIGIYSSGLKRRDTDNPVVFVGIQSAYKRAAEFGERHIFLIDECDLLSPTEETMYQRFYNEAKEINPNILMAGLTASPYRLKEGCLTNLDIWDEVCIDLTKTERFRWFIDNGYLKPLVTKKTKVEIDITNVAMRGGDFSEKELQEVSDTDELNNGIVDEAIRYGSDRKHWLVFASGIKHGYNLEKIFNSRGIPAVMVTGEDDMEFRQETEADFRSGKVRVLINCGLFSRGWDFKPLDMIIWARATQSTAFWVQANLRGTRASEGVKDCLVLDHAGNIKRLGPVDAPIIPVPRRKGDAVAGEAPVKECPQCYSYVAIQCHECPDCGYAFPPPTTIRQTASTDEIMAVSTPKIVETLTVRGVRYQAKVSKAGAPYFEVRYSVPLGSHNEVLFFQFKNKKNTNWWLLRGGETPIPDSVEEAIERTDELKEPLTIDVEFGDKYPKVVGVDME
jgi:DNA repair protein RadD